MWLMLQQPEPDDYVIATGETHSVREFAELAFSVAGLDYRDYVVIDPALYRPAEVTLLLGDASKASEKLAGATTSASRTWSGKWSRPTAAPWACPLLVLVRSLTVAAPFRAARVSKRDLLRSRRRRTAMLEDFAHATLGKLGRRVFRLGLSGSYRPGRKPSTRLWTRASTTCSVTASTVR